MGTILCSFFPSVCLPFDQPRWIRISPFFHCTSPHFRPNASLPRRAVAPWSKAIIHSICVVGSSRVLRITIICSGVTTVASYEDVCLQRTPPTTSPLNGLDSRETGRNFSLRACLKTKDIADLIFWMVPHSWGLGFRPLGGFFPAFTCGVEAKTSNHLSTSEGVISRALTSPHSGRMYPSRFDSCTSTVPSPLFPIAPVFLRSEERRVGK